MPVDELHTTWAELDQLEREEKHLAERLSVVHMKIKARKTKIDVLVKGRPPSINRLPLELLSRILIHSMSEPEFPERSLHGIAGVSRRWRDVILNTPTFWTSVMVTPGQWLSQFSLLRRQLKRSCVAPLDIWIRGWYYSHALQDVLDIILPHTNRWRTLTISNNAIVVTASILRIISLKKFPSLREISVHSTSGGNADRTPLLIISHESFLALQHLTLALPLLSNTWAPLSPINLRTLDLTLPKAILAPLKVTEIASSQSLTLLTLSGDDTVWSLKRDTLHFPLLEELRLRVNSPTSFLEAIIAPKLEHVECTPHNYPTFDSIEGKFRDVGHLRFEFQSFDAKDVDSLCRAFPAVRHVDLSIHHDFYFEGVQPPINQWQNLETVTIYDFGRSWWPNQSIEHDRIVEWLSERKESGQPQLCVRLPGTRIDEPKVFPLLRRCCNLELLT